MTVSEFLNFKLLYDTLYIRFSLDPLLPTRYKRVNVLHVEIGRARLEGQYIEGRLAFEI